MREEMCAHKLLLVFKTCVGLIPVLEWDTFGRVYIHNVHNIIIVYTCTVHNVQVYSTYMYMYMYMWCTCKYNVHVHVNDCVFCLVSMDNGEMNKGEREEGKGESRDGGREGGAQGRGERGREGVRERE